MTFSRTRGAQREVLRGALLLNLGSPDAPYTQPVRAYLKEFLMDPWVIDIPYLLRWLLVNVCILPRRPQISAQAYRKVWTERGSPLRFHLEDLVEGVQRRLNQEHEIVSSAKNSASANLSGPKANGPKSNGQRWLVRPAMRYGKPSIESALVEFEEQGVDDVVVFPLYPQYSLAATESSIRECRRQAQKFFPQAKLSFVSPFFDDNGFIEAYAELIRSHISDGDFDHLLFSFHGLPERQVKKADPRGHCFSRVDCCDSPSEINSFCYRSQCYTTARQIAQRIGLPEEKYTVCFQSRLGRTPWLKPFTDHLYQDLPKKGVKRLAVVCPAFVADCLETLEEVQIRGREMFIKSGGTDLMMIPCLNSEEPWVQAVCDMLKKHNCAPTTRESGPKGTPKCLG